MAMDNRASALGGVAIGLVIGILGGRVLGGQGEELAVSSLDQLTALAEAAIARDRAGINELYAPGAPGPDVAAGPTPLPPAVRERMEALVALYTPTFQITRQRIGQTILAVERLIQKGDGGVLGESIDLIALRSVDLSGGSLGDRRRNPASAGALALPMDLVLEKGERLRLFTGRSFGDPPEPGTRIAELHGARGIWEGEPGEGDRIWIADSRGQVLLDLDYLVP
jgi:hypothetical protein